MTDKGPRPVAVEALIREIQRYLVFVEAVRAGGTRPPRDKSAEDDA
jgi:hypothetical protein